MGEGVNDRNAQYIPLGTTIVLCITYTSIPTPEHLHTYQYAVSTVSVFGRPSDHMSDNLRKKVLLLASMRSRSDPIIFGLPVPEIYSKDPDPDNGYMIPTI